MLNWEHDLPNTYPCEVLLSRKVEKTRTTYQWMLNREHDLPNINLSLWSDAVTKGGKTTTAY